MCGRGFTRRMKGDLDLGCFVPAVIDKILYGESEGIYTCRARNGNGL